MTVTGGRPTRGFQLINSSVFRRLGNSPVKDSFGSELALNPVRRDAREPRCLSQRKLVDKLMDPERKISVSSISPEGRYANYFKIGHNAFELIIQCGQCYADNEEPQLHTTIITSPGYGKSLLQTLRDCLDEYEKTYGPLQE